MDVPQLVAQAPVLDLLAKYFPKAVAAFGTNFLESSLAEKLLKRLAQIESEPVSRTHFNQLLHLMHEAGVSDGMFKYYFLSAPVGHPYPLKSVIGNVPSLPPDGIRSWQQFEWGLKRFYIDGLLYWGNIRTAFRELRTKSFEQIEGYFNQHRYDPKKMGERGKVLAFNPIAVDDRYLISEMACKAYSKDTVDKNQLLIERLLTDAYRKNGGGRIKVKALFDEAGVLAKEQRDNQMMLQLGAEELMEEFVEDEAQLRGQIKKIAAKFDRARAAALENSWLYLSIVNELDVYVATSMRKRDDFRSMAKECQEIVSRPGLKSLHLRYFDPTFSAADGHEDKGLIECLMVKCAKAVLYFAGESDSYGKDAEIAMAMSLGKPVVILCPNTPHGKQREQFFRDVHPLSRLICFETGVPIGAMVTQSREIAGTLFERIFNNEMEYDLEHDGNGHFKLRERLTQSVVRVQTGNRMLRETFWNYYHGIS
jgi:hypothetical protein